MIDKKTLTELCKKHGTTKYRLGIEMYGKNFRAVYAISNPTQKMVERINTILKKLSKNKE